MNRDTADAELERLEAQLDEAQVQNADFRAEVGQLKQLLHEAALGWTRAPQDWRKRAVPLLGRSHEG